jgi:pyruvate dehydrogenase E2 component (dihydrolipoamide acetyltransferase)
MAVEIVMPHLSDSMEEGTIVHWFVSAGDTVAEGDPLLEVETDKATVTYEAEQDGTVLSVTAQQGDSVAVGAVIAVIGAPGEAVPIASPGTKAVAEAANAGDGAGDGDGAASALAGAATVASPPADVSAAGSTGRRIKASPLARRVAAEFGVDLASLVGSGPHGRVIRSDVERSVAASPATGGKVPIPPTPAAAAETEASGPPSADGARGATTRTSLSRLQQTIARRMAQSRATVPDFELRCEVDMTATVALRAQIRDVADPPPSYNDFIVKAAATALREFPRVNSAYRDEIFEHYGRVNIGIAVAAEDALVVPTIFDADMRSLSQIAATARELAGKVRDGSISPAELAGGTFSVSNLGMHGIDSFSAVVNAPQAAILAVGSLKQRPIVDEAGAIVARPTLQLTLACDHRILYGADGARFLGRIRDLLQAPVGMLV